MKIQDLDNRFFEQSLKEEIDEAQAQKLAEFLRIVKVLDRCAADLFIDNVTCERWETAFGRSLDDLVDAVTAISVGVFVGCLRITYESAIRLFYYGSHPDESTAVLFRNADSVTHEEFIQFLKRIEITSSMQKCNVNVLYDKSKTIYGELSSLVHSGGLLGSDVTRRDFDAEELNLQAKMERVSGAIKVLEHIGFLLLLRSRLNCRRLSVPVEKEVRKVLSKEYKQFLKDFNWQGE